MFFSKGVDLIIYMIKLAAQFDYFMVFQLINFPCDRWIVTKLSIFIYINIIKL